MARQDTWEPKGALEFAGKGRLRRFRNFFAKKFLKTSKNLIAKNAFIKAFRGLGNLVPQQIREQALAGYLRIHKRDFFDRLKGGKTAA